MEKGLIALVNAGHGRAALAALRQIAKQARAKAKYAKQYRENINKFHKAKEYSLPTAGLAA
jgi:hypothetical protein